MTPPNALTADELECVAVARKNLERWPNSREAVLLGIVQRLTSASIADSGVRNAALEAAANCVPTNWLDELLTGPAASKHPLDNRGVEKLLRGIQDRIRSLKSAPPKQGGE